MKKKLAIAFICIVCFLSACSREPKEMINSVSTKEEIEEEMRYKAEKGGTEPSAVMDTQEGYINVK